MTVVVDASAIVAGLTGIGPAGSWANDLLAQERLVAPQHMPAEVANVLRRSGLHGVVSPEDATRAHADLIDLRLILFGYRGFAQRAWELRDNLRTYDAWYVALAEELRLPLVTLDRRMAATPGVRCEFVLP